MSKADERQLQGRILPRLLDELQFAFQVEVPDCDGMSNSILIS